MGMRQKEYQDGGAGGPWRVVVREEEVSAIAMAARVVSVSNLGR